MFDRSHLDKLFEELKNEWQDTSEYEKLSRDAHLAIALSDADRPFGDDIDPRVVSLVEKHKPK